jgi:aspartate carbamoyltransferase catalytic subunit
MKNHLDPTDLDVLYMAGCPPGPAPGLPVNVRRRLSLGRDEAAKLGPNAIVLCPLPRIDEIDSCVDDLPQAAYFRASAEGLFVRMAILEACLAGS